MSETKDCENCGQPMLRRPKDSTVQWQNRAFCSFKCSNSSKELKPLHLRFWENVQRRDGNRCWLWSGTKDNHGYGKISFGGRTRKQDLRAHRLSYELHYGPIAEGMNICHVCDTPACVNPSHLYEGSQRENMQDAVVRGRLNPSSLNNLRPGAHGYHGAGPQSNLEKTSCLDQ